MKKVLSQRFYAADTGNDGGSGSSAAPQGGNPDAIDNLYAGGDTQSTQTKPVKGSNEGDKGGEGAKLAAWADQLSKELKSDPEVAKALGKFQKLDELAKSHLELEKKLAELDAGKPKDKDGYSIAKEKDGGEFAELAAAIGLTDTQATEVWKYIKGLESTGANALVQQQESQIAKTNAELRGEFGPKWGEKFTALKKADTNRPSPQTHCPES
jgi:biotin operon repressor